MENQEVEHDSEGRKMIDGYYVEDDRHTEQDLENPEEWVNMGDVNPEIHGGNFIRWENNMWNIVITTHQDVLPKGTMENKSHMIEDLALYPEDVWVDGDPENGFTEAVLQDINSLTSMSQPETTWDMNTLLSTIAVGLPSYRNYNRRNEFISEDTDYWDYLKENHDIPNPDQSDNVGRY